MSVSPVYSSFTPPAPPPKPSAAHDNVVGVSQSSGPPLPPPPGTTDAYAHQAAYAENLPQERVQGPPEGWLPEILLEKSLVNHAVEEVKLTKSSTADLITIVNSPSLQQSLIHSPPTAHPALLASTDAVVSQLDANISLSTNLLQLEHQLQDARQRTQSRLLALRALERQWKAKQTEQDDALRDFSAPALYQKLSAGSQEQELLCKGLEESFLMDADSAASEGNKKASDREVAEFVRRLREARRVAYMRREQKERWDEGRIGGWRG